ncbi:DUF1353 domain-containing protein [Pseudomonas ogarae]|uniref:DUF1353 domain-containing protein n=1 Tax=Pseudomonas ogarae (strain DSM 112162 / CECT 30235 / F113) TaxID=1114970 RepID=UPI001647B299|nr:DUF1353 domain-containing protein [Pseudomonas zarinae]QXH96129.1 DUF1353 domain-containing protein [Pseudomonas zarinae]
MSRFSRPLRAELQNDRETWRLLDPLIYLDAVHGVIEVPAGFETDFTTTKPLRTIAVALLTASVVLAILPWGWLCWVALLLGIAALALYAAMVGYANKPSAVHDWVYQTRRLPRREADDIYRRACRDDGIARWRAWIMWIGVRVGAASRYGKR